MLTDLELGLVALVKASALAPRLRQIDTLPDLEGESLVARFSTDAPAVYVAMGSFPVRNGYIKPKFGVACVARNSRGQQAARHGDGIAIGLHEMLVAVMSLIDGASVNCGSGDEAEALSFSVVSCDLVASEALYQKGIYAGVIQIQSTAEVRLPAAIGNLSDFKTFHSDFDIDPHQVPAEHNKWLQEPPNLSTSAPELSDTIILQE